MALDLSKFVSANKSVEFFGDFHPGAIDVITGEVSFDDESKVFGASIVVPIRVMILLPIDTKKKKQEIISSAAIVFEPELDEENDLLIAKESVVNFILNSDDVVAQLSVNAEGDYEGSLKCLISVPRVYYARNVGELTRKEQAALTSMNLNIITELKAEDPDLVNRLMGQVESGAISSDRIDAAINLEIAMNNPQFMDRVAKGNERQLNAQIAMLLGASLETIDMFEEVPRGGEILAELREELGIVRKEPQDNVTTKASALVEIEPPIVPIVNPVVNVPKEFLEGRAEVAEASEDAEYELDAEVADVEVVIEDPFDPSSWAGAPDDEEVETGVETGDEDKQETGASKILQKTRTPRKRQE
jgi:hypothetical protein